MSKGLGKALKIIPAAIRKGLKFKRRLIEGLVETIKQGKLERNAGKVSNVNFGSQDFEFSWTSSVTSIPEFELAQNRSWLFPCVGAPSVIGDSSENELCTGSNREMVISAVCTPTFGQLECRSPLLSPFSVTSVPYSPVDEVDHMSEEFIRWFRSQYLQSQ